MALRAAGPVHAPFDDPSFSGDQGVSFAGLQAKLGSIKRLGAGATWLSPALKNLPFAAGQTVHVVVDAVLNPVGRAPAVLFGTAGPGPVQEIGGASIEQADGSTSQGSVHATRVALQTGEVQILG